MLKRKMKRFVAFAVAAVIALTPTMAFAAIPGAGSTPTVTWEENTDTTFTTATAANFNFILDPHGIYGMNDVALAALVPHPTENRLGTLVDNVWTELPNNGQVIFAHGGTGGHFINDGTGPLAVSVAFQFTATGTNAGDVTAVATPGAVADPSDANLFIGATFSYDNVRTGPATIVAEDEDFYGVVTLPVLASSQAPVFRFAGAQWTDSVSATAGAVTVTRNAERLVGTGNGTQFALAGICNPLADWSDVLSEATIGLTVTVTTRQPTANDTAASAVTITHNTETYGAFGLVHNATGPVGLDSASFIYREVGSARDEYQQAAFEATTAANEARTAATNALTPLNLAYNTFYLLDDPEPSDEADLQYAIDNAETALGLAQAALAIAEYALEDAEEDLDADDANLLALEVAVGLLDAAVTALADRIAEAEELLGVGLTFGFVVNQRIVSSVSAPLSGTVNEWTHMPFYSDGHGVDRMYYFENGNNEILPPGTFWVYVVEGDPFYGLGFAPGIWLTFHVDGDWPLTVVVDDGTAEHEFEFTFSL